MAIYPNAIQPMPFMKPKNKHQPGTTKEKNITIPEKKEGSEQIKEENNDINEPKQNEMQEDPKL